MLDHLGHALASADFMPHGMCYLWQPEVLWLHVLSDGMIAGAYYSIPFALVTFAIRRRDLVFRGIFLLFGTFILACGTTHLMSIWTVWNPDYWLDGGVKLVTAVASVLTAGLLWRVMPDALALPSRDQLESRVRERTAELEAANDRLLGALREKEVLLREVHHRVKNNLQVVSGLLTLQARHADPELMSYFHASLERIRAMGRVHEQLYRADDVSSLEADHFLRAICGDLATVYGGSGRYVSCDVEVDKGVRIGLDIATPLALILNEAVSNALKHAFPEGRPGRILVRLARRPEGGLELAIEDNGVGQSADKAGGPAKTMGMRLIDTLSRQIGAQLTFETCPAGEGMRLTLLLPPESRSENLRPTAEVA